ncbi:MAG: TetR/AcrR family transcriptional regulator, partial [Acidimicrobiales bacterium]
MPEAAAASAAGTVRARRAQYDVARLLAVAVEVFIERGYDGTSMEDLARATGISKSSIYHHVESKEQLLRLALERALDALFAITSEEGAKTARAIDRLQYVIGRVVEVLGAELPYVTVLLRVRGNTETERWALERRRQFDRFVRAIVIEAAADGGVREDLRPALVERLVLGMINSITEWYRPGRVEVGE